jgi:entericidin B
MNTIRIMCCLILFSVVCLFAGCHTVHGAGEDIEHGGQAIEKAADKHM